jgi:hypothetical protein
MQPYPPHETRKNTPTWVFVLAGCGGCGCLAALGVIGFMFYLSRGVATVFQELSKEMQEAGKDFKVQEHKLVTHEGKRYIVGTAKNISPTNRYSWVSIEFSLTDAAGTELDSTTDMTENEVKPGEVWRFKAPIEAPEAVKYKFRGITGMKVSPEWENMDPETKAKMEEIKTRTRERIKKIIEDSKQQNPSAGGE